MTRLLPPFSPSGLIDFLPQIDTTYDVRPVEVSLSEAPGSHTVITWEDSRVPDIGRTLRSRVLVHGQWMPTLVPLPNQLNARGEGLIGCNRTETGDHYWMPNLPVGSVNTTGKSTALWRNGKVLTIPDLLGSEVDPDQVGTLWDINDHGLIAANSPTQCPVLLAPVEFVAVTNRDGGVNPVADAHGKVCGIPDDAQYDHNSNSNYVRRNDRIIRLGYFAAGYNTGPTTYTRPDTLESIIADGSGIGIACVAEAIAHESHHIFLWDFLGNKLDTDKDGVSDEDELWLDGIVTDINNKDTYDLGTQIDPAYKWYGDNEIRCKIKEINHDIQIKPEKDWAFPGCNSAYKFGPDKVVNPFTN